MRLIGIAALAVLMTGGACAQTDLDGSFPAGAGVSFEEVHKALTADFLDPRSAQYKGMSLQKTNSGKPVICGWINSKNSAGGYTPFYPFTAVLDDNLKASVASKFGYEPVPAWHEMYLIVLQQEGCQEALGLPPPKSSK